MTIQEFGDALNEFISKIQPSEGTSIEYSFDDNKDTLLVKICLPIVASQDESEQIMTRPTDWLNWTG